MTELADGLYRRRPGAISYGHVLGAVMLDLDSPFIPGDVGNASTFAVPVLYRQIPGLTVAAILADSDRRFERAVVDAALQLRGQGVAAITSNCGFMIRYQKAVADAVGIPTVLSSLVLLPAISALLPSTGTIGIVTADANTLTEEFVRSEVADVPQKLRIAGLEAAPSFGATMFRDGATLDPRAIEAEVLSASIGLSGPERPDAVLVECAALPPYAHALQERLGGVPVFDITAGTSLVTASLQRRPFAGYY